MKKIRYRYKELWWTTHAWERMRERGLTANDVWACWKSPDTTRKAAAKGAWVYHRATYKGRVETVVTKNSSGDWVVISCWLRGKTSKNPKTSWLKRMIQNLFEP